MNNRYIVNIDQDLIFDPISWAIMRHPVLASDGHHYELEELYQHFLHCQAKNPPAPFTSPFVTNRIITNVIYDFSLKSTLDSNFGRHRDRYRDYNKDDLLEKINRLMSRVLRPLERRRFVVAPNN